MRVQEIGKDLPCLVCGYNLRTRELRGRCPECGAPVGKAVAAWPMRGRQNAARFIRGIVVIAVLNTILALTAYFVFWHLYFDGRSWWFDRHPGEALFLYFAGYSTAMALAAWYVTAVSLTGQLNRTGRWIRWSSVCFAGAHVLPLLMIVAFGLDGAAIVFWYIFLPSAWVLNHQLGVYFEEVCWARGFPQLGRRCVHITWVLVISLGCAQVLALPAFGLPDVDIWRLAFVACLYMGSCALIIATALQCTLALRLRLWVG